MKRPGRKNVIVRTTMPSRLTYWRDNPHTVTVDTDIYYVTLVGVDEDGDGYRVVVEWHHEMGDEKNHLVFRTKNPRKFDCMQILREVVKALDEQGTL